MYVNLRTRNDDFTGKEHADENNIEAQFVFKNGGKYFKLTMDMSPQSFLNIIQKNSIRKPLPWGEYKKYSEEEVKQNGGRKGFYSPSTGVTQTIASLVPEGQ